MDSIVLLAWAERNRSFRKPILWRRSGETGTTAPELIVISSVERGVARGQGKGGDGNCIWHCLWIPPRRAAWRPSTGPTRAAACACATR